jgi:hypothetical protein
MLNYSSNSSEATKKHSSTEQISTLIQKCGSAKNNSIANPNKELANKIISLLSTHLEATTTEKNQNQYSTHEATEFFSKISSSSSSSSQTTSDLNLIQFLTDLKNKLTSSQKPASATISNKLSDATSNLSSSKMCSNNQDSTSTNENSSNASDVHSFKSDQSNENNNEAVANGTYQKREQINHFLESTGDLEQTSDNLEDGNSLQTYF